MQTWWWGINDMRIISVWLLSFAEQCYQFDVHIRAGFNFVILVIISSGWWMVMLIRGINIVGKTYLVFVPKIRWKTMFEIAGIKNVLSLAQNEQTLELFEPLPWKFGLPWSLTCLGWNLALGEELCVWARRILEFSEGEGEVNCRSCCKIEEKTLVTSGRGSTMRIWDLTLLNCFSILLENIPIPCHILFDGEVCTISAVRKNPESFKIFPKRF